jgi:hypothetical protein
MRTSILEQSASSDERPDVTWPCDHDSLMRNSLPAQQTIHSLCESRRRVPSTGPRLPTELPSTHLCRKPQRAETTRAYIKRAVIFPPSEVLPCGLPLFHGVFYASL